MYLHLAYASAAEAYTRMTMHTSRLAHANTRRLVHANTRESLQVNTRMHTNGTAGIDH